MLIFYYLRTSPDSFGVHQILVVLKYKKPIPEVLCSQVVLEPTSPFTSPFTLNLVKDPFLVSSLISAERLIQYRILMS